MPIIAIIDNSLVQSMGGGEPGWVRLALAIIMGVQAAILLVGAIIILCRK